MNVLVTGGTGFIGSNVVRHLASEGHQVWCLSRQVGGLEPVLERFWAPVRTRITAIAGDITDSRSVHEVFAQCRPSHVIHAAAASSGHSVSAPRRIIRVNVLGAINVLEAASAHSVGRVLHVSSAAVYGQTEEDIAIEENAPLCGTGAYARSKIATENLCELYRLDMNCVDAVIVRLGWTFGSMERPMPGSRETMSLVHQIVRLALSGREIRLAHLEPVRDWASVDDVSGTLGTLLTRSCLRHHIYNLSGGVSVPHRRLLSSLARIVPISFREVPIEDANIPSSSTEKRRGPLSIERLVQDARAAPMSDLEEGLRRYVRWLRQEAGLCEYRETSGMVDDPPT